MSSQEVEKKHKKKKKSKSVEDVVSDEPSVDTEEVSTETSQKKKKKEKKLSQPQEQANDVEEKHDGSVKKNKKSKKTDVSTEKTKEKTSAADEESDVIMGSDNTDDDKSSETFGVRFRESHSISLEGIEVSDAVPLKSFKESGITADLLKVTETFKAPTPIQAQCIPILMQGRDCIGIAKTGSGKTLAFGLPGLFKVKNSVMSVSEEDGGKKKKRKSSRRKPSMLVVAPTRELAMQSAQVLEKVAESVGLKSICVYGGQKNKFEQVKEFQGDLDLVVCTPGRLLGLIEENGSEAIDLSNVSYLVLDEADRMLDMGFEPDIRRIMAQVGSDRQTVMFSATWPVEIRALAHEFLSNPVRVVVGSVEATANVDVSQTVEVIEDFAKDRRLLELLKSYDAKAKKRPYKILVFALYKKEAARLESLLLRNKWKCEAIHGDKNQSLRTAALQAFSTGKTPILVATDVAARGLDIPEVELVLNYSFPLTIEDYIHRIGRTGRAGAKGISHTFFCTRDKHLSGELVNVLKKAKADVPEDLLKFGTAVKKKTHSMYGDHFKSMDISEMPKAKKIKFED